MGAIEIFQESQLWKRFSLGGISEITCSIKESAVAHYPLFMLLLLVNYLLGRAAEVLWHPVDARSHSSIRVPLSRAGAHLHKKYMDTFLAYVTLTTNLFLPLTLEAVLF